MNPIFDAVLWSWPFHPWLMLSLSLTLLVYLRGWRELRQLSPHIWQLHQPTFFVAGLLILFLALASPIDTFGGFLLQVHMIQHLLLMMVVPPLLWLGSPYLPLVRGLPVPVRSHWVGPILRWPSFQKWSNWVSHPLFAWFFFVATTWIWHLPALYELALDSPLFHYLQHGFFLGSGLLFWYPIIRPYPSRPSWSLWLLAPYLLLADLQNTALSALFCFSNTVLYPTYESVPRLGNLSALTDQAIAGVLMWIPGSIAYLIPLLGIGLELFRNTGKKSNKASRPSFSQRVSLPLATTRKQSGVDLLNWPLMGSFLRWRWMRPSLQLFLAFLAILVIWDGLRGPPAAPLNLAGVLPWIHWRGFLVIGLLTSGNLFCLACPFLLPRMIARKLRPATLIWPRALRNKWPAILLLGLFLWAYEAFSLWDSPWITAWIIIGYFLMAFVTDALFQKAAFCKYLCPVGQFNFLFSTLSPLEVKIRDPGQCDTCKTRDCIRGREDQRGCELDLYLPHKQGNLDCTFCLDCVHACPHDNIGLLPVIPGSDLWTNRSRSGIGRLHHRADLAFLVLVFTFGAFANAAGMVAPIVELEDSLQNRLGLTTPFWIVTVFMIAGLVLIPGLLVGMTAWVSCWFSKSGESHRSMITRFSYSLVPIGCGLWTTHYTFHFLTSYQSIIPVTQRFLIDHGWPGLGGPQWAQSCCLLTGNSIYQWEILCLNLGLLLSLYTAYRIGCTEDPTGIANPGVISPWLGLIILLYGVGIWIIFQPMQMRGLLGSS